MRRLVAFNHVTLDGYFTGPNGDMAWAHAGNDDAEFGAFVAQNASGGGDLLFGRITYDLMASFWPTPAATQMNPTVAEGMNSARKVVFSRSLDKALWNNTTVIKQDIAAAVRKMKQEPGPGMAILGSGTIISQLAPEGVIDEFDVIVNPIVLGRGRTMFDDVRSRLNLKLVQSKTFANGKVFLRYEPQS